MSGNRIGGLKAARTNKKYHGEDFYRDIGKLGGKKGRTGGFFANRELARIAGAKGGRNGTRQGVKNGQGRVSLAKAPTANKIPVNYQASLTFPQPVWQHPSVFQRIIRRFR